MSRPISEKGFRLDPQHLNENAWFYEDEKGLTIAYTARGTLQDIVGMVEIPWRKLKGPIERRAAYIKTKQKRRKKT